MYNLSRLSEDLELSANAGWSFSNSFQWHTYRQLELLAKWDATGPGPRAPVGGGARVGSGALWGVLLWLAACVAGGTLRLEHLPPKILPAQQSARDLFLTGGGTEREKRKVARECLHRDKDFAKQEFNFRTVTSSLLKGGEEAAGGVLKVFLFWAEKWQLGST